ncbi:hypothetical protein NIES2100_48880 [Calothrix sp. NIES-2100]|uniref:hypothetical protein n=1 Tax=Calothrix sp. NIES-2100 TaxID=1954172 RepID=UPI000B5E367E|nr:hypothetical protein NIES2100_48880 [Calothrix sp. NIES-2100]
MTILWFLMSELRIRQALQWWANKQSLKRFLEAEKIRDDLLQESFTIRRTLDMLTVDNLDLSVNKIKECVGKIDNFHQSLVELSDRLFPWHLEYSLPLAIECLLESRLLANSHLSLHIDMPVIWERQPVERNLMILSILDDLLTIALPAVLTPISISICLKQRRNICYLMVKINYPDVSTMDLCTNLRELKYLCDSFYFLTSGKCVYRSKQLGVAWYFYW